MFKFDVIAGRKYLAASVLFLFKYYRVGLGLDQDQPDKTQILLQLAGITLPKMQGQNCKT